MMLNLSQMESLAKEIGVKAVLEQEYPEDKSVWEPMLLDGKPESEVLAFAWSYL